MLIIIQYLAVIPMTTKYLLDIWYNKDATFARLKHVLQDRIEIRNFHLILLFIIYWIFINQWPIFIFIYVYLALKEVISLICIKYCHFLQCFMELSLSRSYGSWIYNYLCNQCLSPLKLWVRTPFMMRFTRYNIMR